jgi:enoyl-CoA hydratase/carnithine racemase
MGAGVSYSLADGVATITMDDGKVNALSPRMLAELGAALDRAEADGAAVVLTGRGGVFSAGFDLGVLRAGGPAAAAMVRSGFGLAARLLAFPAPALAACSGHAVAMGAFLLLAADYRIGVAGPFRITANEVAIGLAVPQAAIELCQARLTPAAFSRAVTLAEVFSPGQAAAAGFLDRVVDVTGLEAAAGAAAGRLARLDRRAHVATKLRARRALAEAVTAAAEAEPGAAGAA